MGRRGRKRPSKNVIYPTNQTIQKKASIWSKYKIAILTSLFALILAISPNLYDSINEMFFQNNEKQLIIRNISKASEDGRGTKFSVSFTIVNDSNESVTLVRALAYAEPESKTEDLKFLLVENNKIENFTDTEIEAHKNKDFNFEIWLSGDFIREGMLKEKRLNFLSNSVKLEAKIKVDLFSANEKHLTATTDVIYIVYKKGELFFSAAHQEPILFKKSNDTYLQFNDGADTYVRFQI